VLVPAAVLVPAVGRVPEVVLALAAALVPVAAPDMVEADLAAMAALVRKGAARIALAR
jgi:hypothetical protein